VNNRKIYKQLEIYDCMETKSESLEETLDKPDWKQWLPIYGIYQMKRDLNEGKPIIVSERTAEGLNRPARPLIFFGSLAYQGASIATGLAGVYGLCQLAEKLF